MVIVDNAVGVPEIVPLVLSNDNPAGSDGLIDQLVAAPPVFVGTQLVIAVLIT